METGRRNFLGGVASAATLALLPARAFGAVSREKSYGMIQISASGMTVSTFRFDLQKIAATDGLSGFERMAPKRSGDPFSVLASPLRPGAEGDVAQETIDTVVGFIEKLKAQHDIPPEQIAIVISSGVASYSASLIDLLKSKMKARTGHDIDVVDARTEARLTFDWVVPSTRRDKVLLIDIGSGNTKGGLYDRRGSKGRFHDLSAAFGTKTMAGAVKKRWPTTRTADFGPRSLEFYGDTVAPLLAPQIADIPQMMDRAQLCLTGGIVWAMATILKPQEMADKREWVKLQPDDFATLLKLIGDGTPYGAGLPATMSETDKAWVLKSLTAVRNTFNPHQLAAGAAIGDGLSKQLRFDKRAQLHFASFANNTWSSQYLIEKFG
jgi:hypothetical protein